MLETLDKINIRDLILEESKKDSMLFDPRTVITQSHIASLKDRDWYKDLVSGQTSRITHVEKAALILFPKEVSPKKLNLNDLITRLEKLKKEHIPGGGAYMDWDKTLEQASLIKTLFPQTDPDILITNQDWTVIKECAEDIRHSYESTKESLPNSIDDGEYGGYKGEFYHTGWLRHFFRYGGWIHRILPSKVAELGLNLPEYLQEGREILENNRREELWNRFFSLVPDLKVLFPNQISAITLTNNEWAKIREFFLKTSRWLDRWLDMGLDILEFQAEEIKVTDQGLELSIPDSKHNLFETLPSLPQTRRF